MARGGGSREEAAADECFEHARSTSDRRTFGLVVIVWMLANLTAVVVEVELVRRGPFLPVVAALGWLAGLVWCSRLAVRQRGLPRSIGLAVVCVAAVPGWLAPRVGPWVEVCLHEAAYLERVERALAGGGLRASEGFVERTDAGPVVGFYWFADRDGVMGLAYDPAGLWVSGHPAMEWLVYTRPCHLWGPWYRF